MSKHVDMWARDTAINNAACLSHLMETLAGTFPGMSRDIQWIHKEWARVQVEIDNENEERMK